MTHDTESGEWPQEAGDRDRLPTTTPPPLDVEDRVVETLLTRGLITSATAPTGRHLGWRVMRAALGVAASVVLVAAGVFIGRMSAAGAPTASPLTGAEQDLYALLLYETEGYAPTTGDDAASRFSEYSAWVAGARARGQFVTGEDLEVDRGWMLIPSGARALVEEATAVGADAPLSGVFFIRARDAAQAIELAQDLPHLRHGGRVLVQKTIPTDVPPPGR